MTLVPSLEPLELDEHWGWAVRRVLAHLPYSAEERGLEDRQTHLRQDSSWPGLLTRLFLAKGGGRAGGELTTR